MVFAGINYVAVLVAAVAGWLTGAVWYGVFGKQWVEAQGKTMEAFKAEQAAKIGRFSAQLPFFLALLAALIMAWVLAGLIGHLGPGQVTLKNGVISAAFAWFGFVLTTITVNNAFGQRKLMLTVIDSGHWLAALVVMGAIVGAWGV
jgi:hypothetical protein